MKGFEVLFLVATSGLLAQARPEDLHSLNILVPVDPRHTAEDWNTIMGARTPSPKHLPGFSNVIKPQTDFTGKIHVFDAEPHITNGYTATHGQFPWQVAIIIDNSYFCGGSLISDDWVLTAAHCAINFTSFDVTLGSSQVDILSPGSRTLQSRTSFIHEEYDSSRINNDIALIKLPQMIDFTLYILPARLPSRAQVNDTLVGETLRCSGWGIICDDCSEISSTLQYVDLSVITNSVCQEVFGELITDTKICVSTGDLKSPCNGDSGGPLVFQEDDGRYTEVGIVSFGHILGCERGYPVAFTRITSYLDWIEEKTGIQIQ
ncbi:Chymotrypsin BI [Cryptotermes secundus]|uniref:Chymotrypsin BI n=1 Tax=Cryptotermes secundus TaxID=105785 RepID=A0A2J7PB73_9NEOP|nr:Chymotrypsin BI [Cryptotermes secundus]